MTITKDSPSIRELLKDAFLRPFKPGVINNPGIRWEWLELCSHMPIIFNWVQLPYAKKFWQMDHLSFDQLHAHYAQVLQSGHNDSLIGYFNGAPVCQVEVYYCLHDEISHHYTASLGDLGIHFLMAPISGKKIDNLSVTMMQSIIRLLFASAGVDKIMGEPDIHNQKANTLVKKAGFVFKKKISMSYKQANLYECTRTSAAVCV